jgi:hypothetical protein
LTNANLSLIQKTTNQVVEETRDRRIAKSMVVAMSCEIVRLESEKETYKVQSETNVNKYYIVKFMDGTPVYCLCKDFEIQSQKNRNHICKHQRAIVLAENYGLVPTIRQSSQNLTKFEETMMTKTTVGPRSYKDDDYTF